MTKLTDLVSELDQRIAQREVRERNAAEARARRAAQAEADKTQETEERRAAQRAAYHRRQAKLKGIDLSVGERVERATTPVLARLSDEQRAYYERAVAYHDKVTLHFPPRSAGSVVVETISTHQNKTERAQYVRITSEGRADSFTTLDEALHGRITDARRDRLIEGRRRRTQDALAKLYVPADRIRPHAWRGEYEPGWEPTEALCSDWRIDASRDPAEREITPSMARATAYPLLRKLPLREREVIAMRFGLVCQAMTLNEIGEHFGLTRERARQIEVQALKRLRWVAEGGAPEAMPNASTRAILPKTDFTLTVEQIDLVKAARDARVSQAATAQALGVSIATFRKALETAQIVWKDREPPPEGDEIVAQLEKASAWMWE